MLKKIKLQPVVLVLAFVVFFPCLCLKNQNLAGHISFGCLFVCLFVLFLCLLENSLFSFFLWLFFFFFSFSLFMLEQARKLQATLEGCNPKL